MRKTKQGDKRSLDMQLCLTMLDCLHIRARQDWAVVKIQLLGAKILLVGSDHIAWLLKIEKRFTITLWAVWDEFGLQAQIYHSIQNPQGSQQLLKISVSVCENSQLNMFVLEMHCFLFSILRSFFLPSKHFSHSAQELIKPPSKHSTDVKVKNSQAIHNKPSAENNLSKLFGENLRSNENARRYLGRFRLPEIMKGPNDMFWIQLQPLLLAAEFGIINVLWPAMLSTGGSVLKHISLFHVPDYPTRMCSLGIVHGLIYIPRAINGQTPTRAVFRLNWKSSL